MDKYRICATKEPCKLRTGKRCGLGAGSSCKHQGAKVQIYDTKEQALDRVVQEVK